MTTSARSMSLGSVMLDVAGLELTPEERDLLCHPQVGGVILFSRNYESPSQLRALTDSIHELRNPHLLIGVDHEGGRVQRFREGFTQLPPARIYGEIYDRDPHAARQVTEQAGWLMAAELLTLGVDFSFAPILDLDRGVSQVIGDRAFHGDPDVVSNLARSFAAGMNRAGMAAVGKHFPGHGSVEADSHVDIPVDQREYADIYQEDIVPFERMIHHGLGAVMPAHVIYPRVAQEPAGYSSVWLQDILRTRLGFQGAILSDDLSMAGARVIDSITTRAETALSAGCDMVLVCNDREAAVELLDRLEADNDPVAHVRLARLHGRTTLTREDLLQGEAWAKAAQRIEELSDGQTLELEV